MQVMTDMPPRGSAKVFVLNLPDLAKLPYVSIREVLDAPADERAQVKGVSVGGPVVCAYFNPPSRLEDAMNLVPDMIAVREMLDEFGGQDEFDAAIRERKWIVIEVEHDIDSGALHEIDVDESLEDVLTRANVEPHAPP